MYRRTISIDQWPVCPIMARSPAAAALVASPALRLWPA